MPNTGSSLARFLTRDELVAQLIELRRLGISDVRWQDEVATIEVAMRRAAVLRGDESIAMHTHRIYIGRPTAPSGPNRRTGVVVELRRRAAPAPGLAAAEQQ